MNVSKTQQLHARMCKVWQVVIHASHSNCWALHGGVQDEDVVSTSCSLWYVTSSNMWHGMM